MIGENQLSEYQRARLVATLEALSIQRADCVVYQELVDGEPAIYVACRPGILTVRDEEREWNNWVLAAELQRWPELEPLHVEASTSKHGDNPPVTELDVRIGGGFPRLKSASNVDAADVSKIARYEFLRACVRFGVVELQPASWLPSKEAG